MDSFIGGGLTTFSSNTEEDLHEANVGFFLLTMVLVVFSVLIAVGNCFFLIVGSSLTFFDTISSANATGDAGRFCCGDCRGIFSSFES